MPNKEIISNTPRSEGRNRFAGEGAAALAKKLGIKRSGMAIALLWAPEGFAERIGVEEGNFDTDLTLGKYDLILFFTASRVLLQEFFPLAITRLEPKGRVWILTPRTLRGQHTNLPLDIVQNIAESLDMIEVQHCRIGETWNAMKFRKGTVTAQAAANLGGIAPYSISSFSSIPITPDPPKDELSA